MDPNANLAEQRELVALLFSDFDNERAPDEDYTYRLVELVEALDEWLSKGGFKPTDWS